MSEQVPDRDLLALLQQPLTFEPRPFDRYASSLAIPVETLLQRTTDMLRRGLIRRFAAVLKHDLAGFSYNVMVAIAVPDERCDDVGAALARLPFITHCYRRTSYLDWPYTVYAMVHARCANELQHCLDAIANASPCCERQLLSSEKEYKKSTLRLPGPNA